MTKEDALKTIDASLDKINYWIPRISNPKNVNIWISFNETLLQMRQAVTVGNKIWTNTENQLELVNRFALKIIDDLPPIRYGHPLDEDAQVHYNHGLSCYCFWCDERKEKWAM